MKKIYVDADACPVKDEIVKVATRHKIQVFMVCNGGIRPFRNNLINLIIVSEGSDEADKWIFEKIKYEDIVLDFENETKKLFKFLNLEYEEGINKFYKTAQNRKMISTPSYSQVTNPIYSSSIGRWKNYESLVKIEKPLRKWIKKLNY